MRARMRSFTNLEVNTIDDQIFDSNVTFFKDLSKKLE